MENIAILLSNKLRMAFALTEYTVYLVDPNKIFDLLSVSYFGRFGHNYACRSLVTVHRLLKEKNPDIKIEDLATSLLQILHNELAEISDVVFDRGSLYFHLKNSWNCSRILNLLALHQIIGVQELRRILIDYSSPNIAKDMHVGHLRSTNIGEAISRLYEVLGHEVHRINHIGDYGLQFGMLIEYLFRKYPDFLDQKSTITIYYLQEFYKNSKTWFDADPEFAQKARQRVVELQSGVPEVVQAWEFIKDVSRIAYNEIYVRLNTTLEEVGESFYQSRIPATIDELADKQITQRDEEGRLVIFVPGIKVPLFVAKSNNSYGYDTTDLAAIRYRLVELKMDQVVYVVDIGQSEHFEQIFGAARMAGWLTDQNVQHVAFGLVLGEDGKKFRSRSGDTIKLIDLLDEAVERATKIVEENNPNLTPEEKEKIIKAVAYGSIKYADLSGARTNSYKFSFDQMLSMKGNTAPYLLYAYVRICAIMRNAGPFFEEALAEMKCENLTDPTENELMVMILQFPEVLERLSSDLMFHLLCNYLYDLSVKFHSFHTKCRCLEFDQETHTKVVSANKSRLLLCEATRRVMERCFYILGLEIVEKM